MFGSFQSAERDALAPLLELALLKTGDEREEFLADLRSEAPAVVARLEQLLETAPPLPTPQVAHTFSERSVLSSALSFSRLHIA